MHACKQNGKLTFCVLACLLELFQDTPNLFSHFSIVPEHSFHSGPSSPLIFLHLIFSTSIYQAVEKIVGANLLSLSSSFYGNLISFIFIPKYQNFKNYKDSIFFFPLKLIVSIYKCYISWGYIKGINFTM